MRPLFLFCLLWACVVTAGLARAQDTAAAQDAEAVVIPNFGTRGAVPEGLVDEFMTSFRRQVQIETGLSVDNGEFVTEGIAASLDPGFVGIIAELGQGRYGVSGEIAKASVPTATAPYVVTILIGDRQLQRSSDLLSQPLEVSDVRTSALALARLVRGFLHPADALPQGKSSLFITSRPGDAEIWIDGVLMSGMTPLLVENLAAGRYRVELRKEGYLPKTETVVLNEERIAFLDTYLTPITGGSIQVLSRPQARVFLDGTYVGVTPLAVQALPGLRTVKLERPGFEPKVLSVPVRNFWVSKVEENLIPRHDPLLFWNAPRGTVVVIDDLVRTDDYVAALPAGKHEVDVRYGLEHDRFILQTPSSGVYRLDLDAKRLVPYRP
ncbi:MAG TPA: PEGA domain-containing protein [Trueperaceae bacterium]